MHVAGDSAPQTTRGVQDPRPGDVIAGRYRIERVIGQGGMGTVYAAQHELMHQRVALKLLLPEVSSVPEAVERFLNEARMASRIDNDHVARVLDVGTLADGQPYMAMEYLEGHDLSAVLEERGALPISDAVDFILAALEAIADAHARGIIHRDLKPSNLFVCAREDGKPLVKVLDFGIAKGTFVVPGERRVATLTQADSVLGSPGYMAPEQLRNSKTVDARADIWSIGIILFEMITHAAPFDAESAGEMFAAILEQPAKLLRDLRADVPAELEAIVGRCLERKAADRFEDVADLATALAPYGSPAAFDSAERIRATLGRRLKKEAMTIVAMNLEASRSIPIPPAPISAPGSVRGSSPHDTIAAPARSHDELPAPVVEPAARSAPSSTMATWARDRARARSPRNIAVGFLGGAALVGAFLLGRVVMMHFAPAPLPNGPIAGAPAPTDVPATLQAPPDPSPKVEQPPPHIETPPDKPAADVKTPSPPTTRSSAGPKQTGKAAGLPPELLNRR